MHVTVNLLEDEIMVRETASIFIEEDVGAASEEPRLEEICVAAPSRPEEAEAVVDASSDSSACPERGEASSSESDQEASLADKGKRTMHAEQDNGGR